MRKINVLRTYNLVNNKGDKLQLQQGFITEGLRDELPYCLADKGYRWRFIGTKIPMPVRSMYWFNGFEESIMLDWLKGNGWYPRTRVEMNSGKTYVYELPFHDESNKGNESPTKVQLTEEAIRRGEVSLKAAVRLLCEQGSILSAIALYRYVHSCSLVEAKHAVDNIRFDNAV